MASESLSASEIELIRNSWTTIKKDGKTFGNQLFLNIFKIHPSYQQYFKSLADIPLSELGSSKRLLAHTRNVMYALTSLIDSLDDQELVEVMLVKIGANHKRHKIKFEMVEELGPVFVDLIKTTLGSEAINDQLMSAWGKLYNSLLAKNIQIGFSQ